MEAGVLRGGGDGASVSEGPESRLAAFRFFRGALLLKQHSCPSAGDRDSHAPREPCSPARCSQGSRTFPAHRGAFCAGPGAIPRKSHPVPFPSVAQSCPTLCDPLDCSTPGLPVHHQLDAHEFEQAPGVRDGQGGLACCSPGGRKVLDTTERLSNRDISPSIL